MFIETKLPQKLLKIKQNNQNQIKQKKLTLESTVLVTVVHGVFQAKLVVRHLQVYSV